ncbi:MAG TPA: hypothetical protein VF796_27055 [Humisphaera sp.]
MSPDRKPTCLAGALLTLAVLLLMTFLSSTALADIPPGPRPVPPPPAPPEAGPSLRVEAQEGMREAKLIIPRKLAQAGEAKPKADAGGIGGARTAVAGVALAGAVALTGLFLARRRTGGGGGITGSRTVSSLLLVGSVGCLLLAGTAMADVAIPGQPYRGPARRPQRPEAPPAPPVVLPGVKVPVVIEWADDGDEVKLVASPEVLKMIGEAKPAPDAPPRPPANPGLPRLPG